MPEPVQSDAAPRPQGQDEGRGANSDHGEDATKNGEHTSSSEGIDATPKDETADTAVLQDKPVTSKSTPATRVKRALLSRYILLAESQITSLPTRTTPVFSLVQDVEPPTLHSNRENRILFYPGCFNHPHAGHAALLWQTYLCTDASTIAVLLFALPDESLSRKQNTPNHTGKDFKLNHFQRRQLWKDDILSRFTWVFPSDDSGDAQIFMRTVQRLAWRDGFDVSFPTLYGGDHISREDVPWGWNGGTCVISGVTRAVDFAPTLDYDDGDEPLRLKGCGRWKKMQQKEWEFREEHDSRFCWPCWPCQKLIAVLGDDDDDGEDDLSAVSPNSDFMVVIECTHAVGGAVYWTRRGGKEGHMIFVPTDLADPDCYVSPSINATMLRKDFLSLHTATRQFRNERKHQVLNIDLLVIYLRLDYRWMAKWKWRRLVDHRNAEDDLGVERMKKEKKVRRKKDDEMAEKRPKRRSSFTSASEGRQA